jgi:hypothetical protein
MMSEAAAIELHNELNHVGVGVVNPRDIAHKVFGLLRQNAEPTEVDELAMECERLVEDNIDLCVDYKDIDNDEDDKGED